MWRKLGSENDESAMDTRRLSMLVDEFYFLSLLFPKVESAPEEENGGAKRQ